MNCRKPLGDTANGAYNSLAAEKGLAEQSRIERVHLVVFLRNGFKYANKCRSPLLICQTKKTFNQG